MELASRFAETKFRLEVSSVMMEILCPTMDASIALTLAIKIAWNAKGVFASCATSDGISTKINAALFVETGFTSPRRKSATTVTASRETDVLTFARLNLVGSAMVTIYR